MKRSALLGLVVLALTALAVGVGSGGPLQPRPTKVAEVDTLGEVAFVDTFEGGKLATAIAIGNGRSYLGMYVFDRWGNCIGRDDISSTIDTLDDLAVTWVPAEAGPYAIHISNLGLTPNAFKLAVH